MDLYLVRHGIAYEPDPAQWPDDKDRPLTPEGEKKFRQAARGLRELVPSVSAVLSSPWARAWRTAEILEKEAHWPAPVASEALESGRSPADALQALQPFDTSAGVVLVGHEPNMHELASYLLTADTGHAQIEFRKGGVAYLQLGEGPPRPGYGVAAVPVPAGATNARSHGASGAKSAKKHNAAVSPGMSSGNRAAASRQVPRSSFPFQPARSARLLPSTTERPPTKERAHE